MTPLESVRSEMSKLTAQLEILRQTEKLLIPIYEAVQIKEPQLPDLSVDLSEVGMTKAIETVLCTSPGVPFTPTAVRNALLMRKFPLPKDNPMAAVHQVLKRLASRNDSKISSIEINNETAYVFGPTNPISAAARILTGNTTLAELVAGQFAQLADREKASEPPRALTQAAREAARNAISPRGAASLPEPKTAKPTSAVETLFGKGLGKTEKAMETFLSKGNLPHLNIKDSKK